MTHILTTYHDLAIVTAILAAIFVFLCCVVPEEER